MSNHQVETFEELKRSFQVSFIECSNAGYTIIPTPASGAAETWGGNVNQTLSVRVNGQIYHPSEMVRSIVQHSLHMMNKSTNAYTFVTDEQLMHPDTDSLNKDANFVRLALAVYEAWKDTAR